jgi:hypothetical protein
MKRLCCFIPVLFIALIASAQDGSAYLKLGVNFANVSTTSDGEVDDANILTSFQVGFMGDLPVGRFFAFQPGLYFTGKGSKLVSGDPNGVTYYRSTTNPYYIELPVNAVIKLPLGAPASSFFFGAGPYIAMGIAGKHKTEGKFLGTYFYSKENIEFSGDDPATMNDEEGAGMGVMKRFDYGLNGTAGFQLNKGMIAINYGYGLAKLQSGSSNNDNNNKHRVLSISVGFKL